jgi:SAM-dependent methyltransferase
VLTVDFERLGVRPGDRVLDLGCGGGRHAFEAWKRGATVVALDRSEAELKEVRAVTGGMLAAGELADGAPGGELNGDALAVAVRDGSFDAVIASEVLEHVWDDTGALAELVRVLRPGGRLAVTVPTRWPERVCWSLDYRYHDTPGGHVRIYHQHELEAKIEAAGCWLRGSHHAHALHSPYWWLRCATGVNRVDTPWSVRRYHDLLVRQIEGRAPGLAKLEQALNPILGKSLVVYAQRVTS